MGNLDAQFRNTFPGYSFRTSGYFNDYKKWSQTSLDTTMNSLRAAGLQGQQLNNAQAVLAQLRIYVHGRGRPICRPSRSEIRSPSSRWSN